MSEPAVTGNGPDLTQGVPATSLSDGHVLVGRVGEDSVLLARRGDEFFAVGTTCTHYGGPLAEGLVVDDTVRCPWHHACFSLRTGEALHAPAFSPIACWSTEVEAGIVFVRERKPTVAKPVLAGEAHADVPGRIVIVGGGAAGFAAAEMLRRERYQGAIVMLSDDDVPPVDRPNLSKDYLAGNAPEDWIPLRPDDFYEKNGIDLRLRTRVTAIDAAGRSVACGDGSRVEFDRLLLATGAEPVRLSLPGIDLPHVFTLRTLADSRAIIARASESRRAVVMGASFIGLEVAASLRARGLEVHVVAPESIPMERILGREIGSFVRRLHEDHGVVFHLEDTATAIDARLVKLKSGGTIEADLVVAGVGVRPRTALAESARLAVDKGVVVNAYLETSAPDIFAAGDIARWPDRHSGESIRVEHWVVAQRQGQVAALNMLGERSRFEAVPFFWSQHYDVPISYVGHAASWDAVEVDGDIAAQDCLVRYLRNGRISAVASIHRDVDSLAAEEMFEKSAT